MSRQQRQLRRPDLACTHRQRAPSVVFATYRLRVVSQTAALPSESSSRAPIIETDRQRRGRPGRTPPAMALRCSMFTNSLKVSAEGMRDGWCTTSPLARVASIPIRQLLQVDVVCSDGMKPKTGRQRFLLGDSSWNLAAIPGDLASSRKSWLFDIRGRLSVGSGVGALPSGVEWSFRRAEQSNERTSESHVRSSIILIENVLSGGVIVPLLFSGVQVSRRGAVCKRAEIVRTGVPSAPTLLRKALVEDISRRGLGLAEAHLGGGANTARPCVSQFRIVSPRKHHQARHDAYSNYRSIWVDLARWRWALRYG